MDKKIKEQVLFIRDSGAVNMFDVAAVCKEASLHEFDELIFFLEHQRARYYNFILTGEMNC